MLKKKKVLCLAAVLFLLTAAVSVSLSFNINSLSSASADVLLSGELRDKIKKAQEADFTILEIVPWEGIGEFGYLVKGEEPIDLDWANVNGMGGLISNGGYQGYTKKDTWIITKEQYDEWMADPLLRERRIFCDGSNQKNPLFSKGTNVWEQKTKTEKQCGYFTKITQGMGDYELADTTGEPEFVYAGESLGDYIWTEDNQISEPDNKISSEAAIGDKVNRISQEITIVYYEIRKENRMEGLAENTTDYFRSLCLPEIKEDVTIIDKDHMEDIVSKEFKGRIAVVTLTPDELNRAVEAGADIIEQSRLIYIHGVQHVANTTIPLWYSYSEEGVKSSADYSDTNHPKFGKENDLSFRTVRKIMEQSVTADEKIVVMFDSYSFDAKPKELTKQVSPEFYYYDTETHKAVRGGMQQNLSDGYCFNIYKLYLMLVQRNPVEFYRLFLKEDKDKNALIDEKGAYFLQQDKDAQMYWNSSTFLPVEEIGKWPQTDYWKSLDIWYNPEDTQNFVRNNVYFFMGDNAFSHDFNNTMYDKTEQNGGSVNEAWEDMFDYYESIGKKLQQDKATPAQAIWSLLAKIKEKVNIHKEKIKILNLEPCNDFTLTAFDVLDWFPDIYYDEENIEIARQTTAEFIGSLNDINQEYDLVYIGTNIKGLNYNSSGTLYNDKQNGMIYRHVGDLLECAGERKGYALRGLMASQSIYESRYRYPGNDISKIKQEELEGFLSADYPIVAEEKLYQLEKEKIDDSSNLYQFIKNNKGKYALFNEAGLRTGKGKPGRTQLIQSLNKEKPAMLLNICPTEYQMNENNLSMTYNQSGRNLTYEFILKDDDFKQNANMDYEADLYVDFDKDGQYNETNEKVRHWTIQPNGITKNKGTYILPDDVSGLMAWKLRAKKSENPSVRVSKEGYTAIKSAVWNPDRKDYEKLKIKVLQINTIKRSTETQPSWNLEQELKDKNTYFGKYMAGLTDYEVEIHSIGNDEFCKPAASWERAEQTYWRENISNDYDIMVLGFGRDYKDLEDLEAVRAVQKFIDSGKGVIFTQDSITASNEWKRNEKDLKISTDSGFFISQFFRTALGMNRFGIYPVKSIQNAAFSNTVVEETDYQAEIQKVEDSIKKEKTKKDTIFDTASAPSQADSNQNKLLTDHTYGEIQGFTYTALMQFSHIPAAFSKETEADFPYRQSLVKDILGPFTGLKINTAGGPAPKMTAGYETTQINRINKGRISRYPYEIEPISVEIQKNHASYYQLNMNNPKIKVWYCLADKPKSTTNWYNASPNDAGNNYYIYSNGNLIYFGGGYSAITANEDEVKLFINTLFAAYHKTAANPEVILTNGLESGQKDEWYIYEDVDWNRPITDTFTNTVPIMFLMQDTNIGTKYLNAEIYLDGEEITKEVKLYDEAEIEIPYIQGTGKKVKASDIKKDKINEYTFLFPVKYLADYNSREIKITGVNPVTKLSHSVKVQIIKRNLFDLN